MLVHDSYQHNLFVCDSILYAIMKCNVYLVTADVEGTCEEAA